MYLNKLEVYKSKLMCKSTNFDVMILTNFILHYVREYLCHFELSWKEDF
jgi:hypothetical protein